MRIKFNKSLLIISVIFFIFSSFVSAYTLFESYDTGTTVITSLFINGQGRAQYFIASANYTIHVIGLYTTITGNPTIRGELWSFNEGNDRPDTRLMVFETRNGLSSGAYNNYTNTTGYALVSGTKYFVVGICITCDTDNRFIPLGTASVGGNFGSTTQDYGSSWSSDTHKSRYRNFGTLAPVDTCTAPGSGNWAVDCSDNCNFSTNQDVPGNMIISGIDFCYQEFTNVSTACGGLSTGSYNFSNDFNDGNWSSFNNGAGDWEWIYAIPPGASANSVWQYKGDFRGSFSSNPNPSTTNYSLTSCFDLNSTHIKFTSTPYGARGQIIYCNDVEIAIWNFTGQSAAWWFDNNYEEAMLWREEATLTLSANLTFTGSNQYISIEPTCKFVIESGGSIR